MTTPTISNAQTNFRHALWLGACLGIVLASVYTLMLSTLLSTLGALETFDRFFSMFLSLVIYGLSIGVIPGAAIGATTGVAIDWSVTRLHPKLSASSAFGMGTAVCLSILTLVAVFFLIYIGDPTQWLFIVGIPGIIYTPAGGWVGVRLYRQKQKCLS